MDEKYTLDHQPKFIIDLGNGKYVCHGKIYSSLDRCYQDLQKFFSKYIVLVRKAREDEIEYWKYHGRHIT